MFWRVHLALVSLDGGREARDGALSPSGVDERKVRSYDTINDSLSDLLLIFYPTYSAKSDI